LNTLGGGVRARAQRWGHRIWRQIERPCAGTALTARLSLRRHWQARLQQPPPAGRRPVLDRRAANARSARAWTLEESRRRADEHVRRGAWRACALCARVLVSRAEHALYARTTYVRSPASSIVYRREEKLHTCTVLYMVYAAGAARPAGISGSSWGSGQQPSSGSSLTFAILIYWFLRLHALAKPLPTR